MRKRKTEFGTWKITHSSEKRDPQVLYKSLGKRFLSHWSLLSFLEFVVSFPLFLIPFPGISLQFLFTSLFPSLPLLIWFDSPSNFMSFFSVCFILLFKSSSSSIQKEYKKTISFRCHSKFPWQKIKEEDKQLLFLSQSSNEKWYRMNQKWVGFLSALFFSRQTPSRFHSLQRNH